MNRKYNYCYLIFSALLLATTSSQAQRQPDVGNIDFFYPVLESVDFSDYPDPIGDYRLPSFFMGCIEGNCMEGDGLYMIVEEQERFSTEDSEDVYYKVRREKRDELFKLQDKYEKRISKSEPGSKKRQKLIDDRNSELEKEKYRLTMKDRMLEFTRYDVLFRIYEGKFRDEGRYFEGEYFEFPVSYSPDGKVWKPNRSVDLAEELPDFLRFAQAEFDLGNSLENPVGYARDHLAEQDPSIDRFTGWYSLFNRLFSRIEYSGLSSMKSFMGILADENDSRFSGPVFGRLEYRDGSVYLGGFKDDRFHGTGRLVTAEGEILEGLWVEGELETPGSLHFPDFFEQEVLNLDGAHQVKLYAGYAEDMGIIGEVRNGFPYGPVLYWHPLAMEVVVADFTEAHELQSYFFYDADRDLTRLDSALLPDGATRLRGVTYTSKQDLWNDKSNHLADFLVVPLQRSSDSLPLFAADLSSPAPGCMEIWSSLRASGADHFNYPSGWRLEGGSLRYQVWEDGDARQEYGQEGLFRSNLDFLEALQNDDTFCSPGMTAEKKQSVIDFEIAKYEADTAEKERIRAQNEALYGGMRGCRTPDILMSSDPARTQIQCNGNVESGVRTAYSQVGYGDVVQYNGAMHIVQGRSGQSVTLMCAGEVFDNEFYVFEGLAHTSDYLTANCPYCDADGLSRTTYSRVTEVPTGGTPRVVWQNSIIQAVEYPTRTSSWSITVAGQCTACNGTNCIPSDYAKGN